MYCISLQVMHLDAEKEMMSQCVALLGKFIAVREPNIRYLGLVIACLFLTLDLYLLLAVLHPHEAVKVEKYIETVIYLSSQENMTRMLLVTDVQDIIKRHQAQIITSLKDPDIRFESLPVCNFLYFSKN